MEKRTFNILFHLHTVSGIVTCVLLYVIFFTGSFSFFRDEIVNWERNDQVVTRRRIDLNLDSALNALHDNFNLKGRDLTFRRLYDEQRVYVTWSPSKRRDAALEDLAGGYGYLDTKSYQLSGYEESYTLGEFLYRLHFFAQIPYPAGYYLSGFTAFFFLFVLLTGILVHWRKVISNFFIFRPYGKLKRVWTDAHTVLGTIGLPFQIVYAVTGAFFMINLIWVAPNVMVLYQGDAGKFYEDLEYTPATFPFRGYDLVDTLALQPIFVQASDLWSDYDVTEVSVSNYGDEGQHITFNGELKYKAGFTGFGHAIYASKDHTMVVTKNPYQSASYLDLIKSGLYRLHYADYGGYLLRIVSFLLGLVGCFVILTGVLIWLEARNKKTISEQKRRYNQWVGAIYLGVCLSLYPVTALTFLVTRLIPSAYDFMRQDVIYGVYFSSWLLLSVYFILKRDNAYTNRTTLLMGGVLGLCIPIANGIITGQWFWLSWQGVGLDSFVVDTLWLSLSFFSFYGLFRIQVHRMGRL